MPTTETPITLDARPEHRYGALMSHLGRRPAGWLPAWQPTDDDIDALVAEADASDPDVWVGWSEFGSIVAAPRVAC